MFSILICSILLNFEIFSDNKIIPSSLKPTFDKSKYIIFEHILSKVNNILRSFIISKLGEKKILEDINLEIKNFYNSN